MFKAMVSKELRETLGIMAMVLVACLLFFSGAINAVFRIFGGSADALNALDYYCYQGYVPFAQDAFSMERFCWVCAAVAIALGLRQTLGESIHGTYAFLFHRPTERRRLIATKLLVGLAVYLASGSILILVYGLWAATPGTHASPFEWSMTATTWAALVEMALIYFAAFLSGLRPARWFGTRLLPLAAVVPLIARAFPEPFCTGSAWHLVVVLVVDAWMIVAILFVARTRDYS
jgi:hypothetical protein